MNKLLLCAHCGSQDIGGSFSDNMYCYQCGASAPGLDAWNTRHTPEGWQPIETAPKDGTEVLGWREGCDIILMRYTSPIDFLTDSELEKLDEESAEGYDWFAADFIEGCRMEGNETPTYWMPPPAAPKWGGE